MEYDLFMKFCRDFTIFPEMCTKPTLHSIFYNLALEEAEVSAELYQRIMRSKVKREVFKNGEYLDEERFIRAMILCAFKSRTLEETIDPLEKVLSFIEKILQSKGVAIVKKRIGKTRVSADDIDPMHEIRRKYAEYFTDEEKPSYKQDLLNQVFNESDIQFT